jgi:hypothetical protein
MAREVRQSHVWYQRIPEADRLNLDAITKWLAPVPWQVFVTATFSWNVIAQTAQDRFKHYLNEVELQLRESVCFIAGMERKPAYVGMRVPWHFHALMAANCQIPTRILEDTWRRLNGPGKKDILHPQGDSIEVRPFNDAKLGLAYCLKMKNDCHGDWLFRRLELFNPTIPKTADHRVLRQRRRMAARAQATGSEEPAD